MKKITEETIFTTTIAGLLLMFATVFMNAFFTSPPSRAEYEGFKATIETRGLSIDRRLHNIEIGQKEIIKTILTKE